MLNLDAIAGSPVAHDPFDYFIAREVVPSAWMEAIGRDFPVVKGTGSVPVTGLACGPVFQQLIDELRSREFAEAVGTKFGDPDLHTRPQLITIRSRSGAKDGFVHTDSEWKLFSLLLYLNSEWGGDGGRLRLLRSRDLDDMAVEVPPDWGTLLGFRRSDRSFHGYPPFFGERRLVQINWVTNASYVAREERRHRVSAALNALLRLSPR